MLDGSLTAVPGSPFSPGTAAGSSPEGLAIFGNVLYAANSDGSITAFDSSTATGTLSLVPGSPFLAGNTPLQVLPFPSFSAPNAAYLFTGNFGDANGSISAYTIGTTGALAPIPGSPFQTVSGSGPVGLLSGGTALYVALKHSNAVAAFSVSPTGVLTALPGSPFPAGKGTSSLASASGFLYAMNDTDHTISIFSINPVTDVLTPVGAPIAAGTASGQLLYFNGILFVPDPQGSAILAFSANPITLLEKDLNVSGHKSQKYSAQH